MVDCHAPILHAWPPPSSQIVFSKFFPAAHTLQGNILKGLAYAEAQSKFMPLTHLQLGT